MANDLSGPGDQFERVADGTPDAGSVRVWIEPDQNAPAGCGRIMVSREGEGGDSHPSILSAAIPFLTRIFGILSQDSPRIVSNFAIRSHSVANDNSFWLGDDAVDGSDGVFGSDVDAATLANGDAVVAWVGDDQKVHARLFPTDNDTDVSSAVSNANLNELLANLGEAGQGAANGPGRLKLVPLGQNGVAAFWLAELGLTAALVGKAILSQISPAEAGEGGGSANVWTLSDLPPVLVPKGANGIAVKVSADGAIKVAVGVEGAEDVHVNLAIVQGADGAGAVQLALADDQANAPGEGEIEPVTLVAQGSGAAIGATDHGGAQDGAVGASLPGQVSQLQDGPSSEATSKETGKSLFSGTPPVIVITQGGIAIAVEVRPGAEPETSTIQFSIIGKDGLGTPTIVTDHAITNDAENLALDLQPAVTGTGDGISLAWLEATDTGGAHGLALKLQSYDADGHAESGTPATVAVSSDTVTSISDFAITYLGNGAHHQENGEHSNSAASSAAAAGDNEDQGDGEAAAPARAEESNSGGPAGNASASAASETSGGSPASEGGVEPSIALVWVQNADSEGYGSIMGQLYGIAQSEEAENGTSEDGDDCGCGQLVALGCDGEQGGGSDAAFAVDDDGTQGNGAIGRAPSVASAGENAIVVTWVQETSTGSGVEVVGGIILHTGEVASFASLDLADLMPQGLVAGTDPQVMTTDDGDIVISWVQADSSGGFDAAAAVYERGQSGGWIKPDGALLLSHFDDVPTGLQLTLTDGNTPKIVVTWQEDGNTVTGQNFDLEGQSTGHEFSYSASEESRESGSGSGSSSDDGMSAAILPDGQLLVVFSGEDQSQSGISAVIVSIDDASGDAGEYVPSTSSTSAVAVIDEANDQIVINLSGTGDIGTAVPDLAVASAAAADGGGTGGDVSASDNLIFVPGFGNDISDYVDEQQMFDEQALSQDAIADAFDALQYANALNDSINMEVITFDATNVVVIRDFETLGS